MQIWSFDRHEQIEQLLWSDLVLSGSIDQHRRRCGSPYCEPFSSMEVILEIDSIVPYSVLGLPVHLSSHVPVARHRMGVNFANLKISDPVKALIRVHTRSNIARLCKIRRRSAPPLYQNSAEFLSHTHFKNQHLPDARRTASTDDH